jgi:hypothetical protein
MGAFAWKRSAIALVVALFSALLAGCSAGAPVPEPPPSSASSTTSISTPTNAKPLADFGYQYGPKDFYLPQSVQIAYQVDQENVVTALFAPDFSAELHSFLTENLAAMGYEIIASSPNSLLFQSPEWEGSFTASTDLSALTLRHFSD